MYTANIEPHILRAQFLPADGSFKTLCMWVFRVFKSDYNVRRTIANGQSCFFCFVHTETPKLLCEIKLYVQCGTTLSPTEYRGKKRTLRTRSATRRRFYESNFHSSSARLVKCIKHFFVRFFCTVISVTFVISMRKT